MVQKLPKFWLLCRKLKQSSELKESALEELNAKFQALDKESKSLRKSLDKMKETCARVKDLERENGELLQELNTDRRTLATLREVSGLGGIVVWHIIWFCCYPVSFQAVFRSVSFLGRMHREIFL